jgi:DNA ligase-1
MINSPEDSSNWFSPMLYSRTSTGAVQVWRIEVHDNKYRTHSGQKDGQQIISEWTACKGKNLGKSNETTPCKQAENEALAKWKKKKETGYFENEYEIDNVKYPEAMLAYNFEDYSEDIVYPVYCQPKLDGIRCLVTKDGMFSRNGKKFVSVPHIFRALEGLFKNNPNLVLDGELYSHKFRDDFNSICSLVKKTKPNDLDLQESAEKIQYWIYDLVDTTSAFSMRQWKLRTLINPNKYIVLVDTYEAQSKGQLDKFYETFLADGMEGQMVRINVPYQNKRTKFLLKRKEFKTEEFRVIGYGQGIGNRSGTMGYLECVNKDGRIFNSNIKGNFEFLTRLWKDREKIVGKMATIRFFNYTPDEKVPRFPFVIAIRDYE